MPQITTLLSTLHEPAGSGSADRLFRDEPVLRWTLRRLARSAAAANPTVLCWEDQAAAVRAAAEESGAAVHCAGARRAIPALDATSAARRWADGWRGGLLGTCEFDRGFYAPIAEQVRLETSGEAVMLVDPAASLVDPALLDAVLAHRINRPELDFCFSPAAPGLSGVLLSAALMAQLAVNQAHPGLLMNYRPDAPRRDPLSEPACVSVPARLARTLRRFTLDSDRQIALISAATAHLNGQLLTSDAMGLLNCLEHTGQTGVADQEAAPLPRELVVEINTDRMTPAIFRPTVKREPMDLETAKRIFAELAEADDARLVFAGMGDPLLHPQWEELLAAAVEAGIGAIALETDLLAVSEERLTGLAHSGVDIISVHLPAARTQTYRAVMGTDEMAQALNNLRIIIQARGGHGTPLVVPTFVKCTQNLAEMEAWYDHWMNTVGCAVITAPSDFGGLIEDAGVADMSPPRRMGCFSLSRRLAVLSDGRIVSCERDATGRQTLGATIKGAWKRAGVMGRNWNEHPLCADCKQWHRF